MVTDRYPLLTSIRRVWSYHCLYTKGLCDPGWRRCENPEMVLGVLENYRTLLIVILFNKETGVR